MAAQIFIGLFVEGTTDTRFLTSVVERTVNSIAFEAKGEIEPYVQEVIIEKAQKGFIEQILTASKKGVEDFGMMIFCVHSDGNKEGSKNTYKERIEPAKEELLKQEENEYCKILVALVPVPEMEAWMLADTKLLKEEIGTTKTDTELGLHRPPETVADPKQVIEDAIRIARANLTKKRRKDLKISELYLPIGQSIDLEKLAQLPSYIDFRENMKQAFIELGYLH